LPEDGERATRSRLQGRCPAAQVCNPPGDVQRAIDAVVALLNGAKTDLSFVVLDVEGLGEFERRAYAVARTIAPGTTTTYGAIAAALGEPGAARAVGQAMGHNPCPVIVPCHRVLASDGSLGGFSAGGGAKTKFRMLAIEGADAAGQADLFEERAG
jgi:methylated-DNA-[protein]-cysteine S-methyltransferase